MDIFAGVDGTGPDDESVYKAEFASSFISKIEAAWRTPCRFRLRGPTWHGGGVRAITETAYSRVAQIYKTAGKGEHRIFLAGYSRGGLAVLAVAERLAKIKVPVHSLLLFDAVDMTAMLDVDIVPDNVAMTYHARRSPRTGSRTSWGNCGTKPNRQKNSYNEKFFYCTHGGMGGVCWTTSDSSGFINEALTGETEMGLRMLGVSNPAMGVLALANDAHRLASRTKVTPMQDQQGSGMVRRWMFAALNERRGVATLPAV